MAFEIGNKVAALPSGAEPERDREARNGDDLPYHTGLAPDTADRKDYVIIDAGREIGRLYEDRTTLPELRWYWSIIVIGAHQAGIKTSGRAATLEAAKEAFRANYRRWLVWAKLEVD
jgi:hypothetical protein